MPIDLDKPINSRLDIPENDVAPVSGVEFEPAMSDVEPATEIPEKPAEQNYEHQMPSVKAQSRAVKKVRLKKNGEKMPEISAEGLEGPVVPWENAPVDPSRAIPPQRLNCGRGYVNFAFSDKGNIIRLVISGFVTLVLTGLLYRFMMIIDKNGGHETSFTVVIFAIISFLIGVRATRLGERWRYEATGREIIFSRKGRASYIIFYKDVMSVSYVPYKFLNFFNSGYIVTIIANGERYEFEYVFPMPEKVLPFDKTPFQIILNHADQLGTDLSAD